MTDWEEVEIDMTPAPRFLSPEALGAQNLGVVNAISEIVANSCDWHMLTLEEAEQRKEDGSDENKKWLENISNEFGSLDLITSEEDRVVNIILERDGKSKVQAICIVDNGIGMNQEDIAVALRLSKKLKRTPLRPRKGMYNIGLQAGWLGLGNKIEIHSKSIVEEAKAVVFELDKDEMEGKSSWTHNLSVGGDGELPPYLEQNGFQHGTVVRISDLTKSNHDWDTVYEGLSLAYSAEIATGVKFQFDGADCEYSDPEIDSTYGWVDLSTFGLKVREDLGGGRRGEEKLIKGKITLMKVAKDAAGGKHGVHTTRRGQLIEAWHNAGTATNGLWPYPNPHADHRRCFGWLELDMVPPNFHKKGWNTESPAWDEVREALKPHLENLITIAKVKKKDLDGQKQAAKGWLKYKKKSSFVLKVNKKKPNSSKKKTDATEKPSEETKTNEEEYEGLFKVPGENFGFEFLEPVIHDEELESHDPPWYGTWDATHIQLHFNVQHPLWKVEDKKNIVSRLSQIDVWCELLNDIGTPQANIAHERERLYWELFSKEE